jgi:RecB family exonuclease
MDNFFIRSSSLSELFDCPSRWEAKHILKMRSPSSSAAHLGTSIHASTAAFDKAVLIGSAITADDALGEFVDTLYDKGAEVDWGDDKPEDLELIGRSVHGRYCADIAPQFDYSGVEVECKALEVAVPEHGVTLTLTGTTDRIRTTAEGKAGIADLKTGKRVVGTDGTVDASKHGAQLAVYELLAEATTGVAMTEAPVIIGLQTTKTGRVGTGTAASTKEVLIGTPESPGLLDAAARILKSGLFYGNPRSQLCSTKYCPRYSTCKWRF